jgi:hypothetical protein
VLPCRRLLGLSLAVQDVLVLPCLRLSVESMKVVRAVGSASMALELLNG